MDTKTDISWRARLPPIAMGYVLGIIATVWVVEIISIIVEDVYRHPPSDVMGLLRTLALLVPFSFMLAWLYVLGALMVAAQIALVLALPATVAIIYSERHKIRALWPHCLGGVLLAFVATAYSYFVPHSMIRIAPASLGEAFVPWGLISLAAICAGLFAGWIYWLIAVKFGN